MVLISPDEVLYLTPIIPRMLRIRSHAMERGLDDALSPPLRRVERGPGGEVNNANFHEFRGFIFAFSATSAVNLCFLWS